MLMTTAALVQVVVVGLAGVVFRNTDVLAFFLCGQGGETGGEGGACVAGTGSKERKRCAAGWVTAGEKGVDMLISASVAASVRGSVS